MQFVFYETPGFTRRLREYLADEDYAALQRALLQQPDKGRLIPGSGGFRKLRWGDRRRSKGTRGGLRIVYYALPAERQIWLFTIYGKDEADDLTAEECRRLRDAIRQELRARKGSV